MFIPYPAPCPYRTPRRTHILPRAIHPTPRRTHTLSRAISVTHPAPYLIPYLTPYPYHIRAIANAVVDIWEGEGVKPIPKYEDDLAPFRKPISSSLDTASGITTFV
ncbi:hypothetical protein FB451DRAFT_1446735 [Mycena latifolia]|nr:hypothetical protein FB451DRAFT_1446735 [Mycena latifolia]